METLEITSYRSEIIKLIERFGPEEFEYPIITKLVNNIANKNEELLFRELFKPVLNEHTLYGHTYLKPFGYAGDYLLIEKIYKEHVSTDPRWKKWDLHYHTHTGTKAVINRKLYFIKTMEDACEKRNKPIKILILGSGPATDVHEFMTKNPTAEVQFDLLDIDQRAIDYAMYKNKRFHSKINFIKMNVLRFMPSKDYDVIWSAGLFDYLNDRLFIGLVNRLKNYLTPSGEMIIGNFSPDNPSKKCMEIIVEWFLIHRSIQQLTQIAIEAGIPSNSIYVDKEPLGINLFLRINQTENQFILNKESFSKKEILLA